jgi:hypothetical protein
VLEAELDPPITATSERGTPAVKHLRKPSLARLAPLTFLAALLVPALASAAPNDKQALDLAKEAIDVDYLGTNFAQAQAKLEQAVKLCEGNGCAPAVKAQVHRDLGLVLITGAKNIEEGKKNFIEALKANPAITLDPDLVTPEVQQAFDEARAAAGVSGAAPAPAAEPAAKPEEEAPPAAAGALEHDPAAEQAVLTPVPVYVTHPPGLKIDRVMVRYKPFGGAWKSVEMRRIKDGWGAEIPCLDVGSTTGDLKYYVEALDAAGVPQASTGTAQAPHRVPIKTELEGDPPHLPGRPPAAQCQDPGDCPPGFPGCGEGEQREGEAGDPGPKNWLSLGVQQDFLLLPSATGVCDGGTGYDCFFEDPETFYEEVPADRKNGEDGNEVAGGFKRATLRVLIGYDRMLTDNIALGARVGFAFGGGPMTPDGGVAFFPVHGEGRATYFFGERPMGRAGLRGFVHLSGGVAQVDAKELVVVYLNEQDRIRDERTTLAAWRKSGTGFAALGGGLMYAIAPNIGPYFDLRLMQLLGLSGTAVSPQLGFALGL